MSVASVAEKIVGLFRQRPVLEMSEIVRVVGPRSQRSLFRDLARVGYLSSYTHTGRYYTLETIPQFDADGLWRFEGIAQSAALPCKCRRPPCAGASAWHTAACASEQTLRRDGQLVAAEDRQEAGARRRDVPSRPCRRSQPRPPVENAGSGLWQPSFDAVGSLNYAWPGNVRELENAMRYALAFSLSTVRPEHLPREVVQAPRSQVLSEALDKLGTTGGLKPADELWKALISRTLEDVEWNQSEAAKRLGISRTALRQKIRAFGLLPPGAPGEMPTRRDLAEADGDGFAQCESCRTGTQR